ncbi:MAG: DUF2135 domain-containing protein [Endomicrobium sp.]|nr:DUF2135 domain-containing protein [Endomicrobium sp.]
MKKTFLAFAIIFTAAILSFAQTKKAPSQNNPQPSAPYISVSSGQKQITFSDLKINIEITGNIAMTTYDMIFYNPNAAVAEGEFVMPLSKNQNISAIALDINGKMREAVAVERKTMESLTAKNIDSSGVDQFKTKIYPFDPEAARRIKITVEEPLAVKDNNYFYNLPLKFDTNVNFDLNAEIPSEIVEGMPIVNTDLGDFVFKKGNNVLKASFSQKDYLLNAHLSLILPKQKNEPVFTHKEGKNTYFYADINVKRSSKNKVLPKTAAIVWDSSVSSEKRNIKRELALLDAYFKKFSEIEVLLVTFGIKPNPAKSYSIKKGDWAGLKKDISRIVYDGATRFDKLKLDDLKADEILLFTDAVSSFGYSSLTAGNVPVYAVNSSPEFNSGALISAALESGGRFINLNSVTDKKAAEMLMKQELKLVSYSFDKNKIKEVYPKPGVPINDGFTVAGILTVPESEITLSFGYDKTNIISTKKIKIRAGGDNPAVERLWACKKIKGLELDSVKNEKEILELGKKYSLVTEFTSLLFLESAADYAAYKVSPPKELLTEYNNIIAASKKAEKEMTNAAIEDAALQAQDIKEWWKHDYSVEKSSRSVEKVKTAFGVKQEEIFKNAIPEASEGEVKAPSSSQERAVYGNSKIFVTRQSAQIKEDIQTVTRIKAWDPQTPYMKIIRNLLDEEMYGDYLKLKAGYGEQPSFYFDIADEFIRRKMKEEAVIVLSNIAEMKFNSSELMRITAYKLMETENYAYAVEMFKKIIDIRAEDPQPYRDLALAYQANKEYKKALETFYKILSKNWERFQSIKQITFVEMNNLISLHPEINTAQIDKRLILSMPVDIRIVLGWSADNTDIDIYVKDPRGEEASYGNRFTNIGARVSEDLTQGFGPEEFTLKKAVDGKYEISTDYFGDDMQSISGPTVLYLDIYTFYGTKKQTHKRIMIRTENVKENNIIGTVDFKRPTKK